MTPPDPLSSIGFLLTLAGLIGSFFYLQLSQWLRDLLALERKAELNRPGATEAQLQALVECKAEFRGLSAWHTHVVNLAVIAFVVFVLALGLGIIAEAPPGPVYRTITLAYDVFLGLFLVLGLGLLALGALTVQRVDACLYPKPRPPKAG
jgi:hypothetical protein